MAIAEALLVDFQDDFNQLSVVPSQVRPVKNFSEYCMALRLVHQRYVATGLMQPAPTGFRLFLRDLFPTSITFVVIFQDRIIGTVSGNKYQPGTLPLSKLYQDQLDSLASFGRVVAEGTKLACSKVNEFDHYKGSGGLSAVSLELLRAIFLWCCTSRITDWMIVVHPRLLDFYHGDLGFDIVGEAKSCAHVANRPGILLRLDISAILSKQKSLSKVAEEVFVHRRRFWSVPSLDSYKLNQYEVAILLLDEAEILKSSSQMDIKALTHYYPNLPLEKINKYALVHNLNSLVSSAPCLVEALVAIEQSDRDGIAEDLNCDPRPECFALRNYLNRLNIVLELIAAKENCSILIKVEDQVPDSLYADPTLIGSCLISALNNCFFLNSKYEIFVSSKFSIGDCLELVFDISQLELSNFDEIEKVTRVVDGQLIMQRGNKNPRVISFSVPCMKVDLAPHLAFIDAAHLAKNADEFSTTSFSKDRALRILLVEDNRVSQLMMKKIISKTVHHLVIAKDGLEALQYFDGDNFDLVLMDIHLPHINGFEVTRQFRIKEESLNCRVPIYAVTSFVMEEDQKRCLEVGMDGYLPKPINLNELICVVNYIVSSICKSEFVEPKLKLAIG